ncbi:hypothetical protein PCL_09551 [Purpureocillium lilacinum]|uniref:Uncharacterized protein n=1 Tax=Purpureocillium lilacinum TaxID=33203 RepID=A0A2U3DQK9_PURLI|nr:hypothetical protein PCL_09551 [Purpureocillium lilacinum]
MRDYLKDGDPDSDLYAARFREETWAGVLKIVRWHVSDFRPKWLPMEGSDDKPPEAEPSTQAANFTDAFCNYAAGLPASSAFQTAFATWLSKQCDEAPDGEELQSDDGARGSKGSHADEDGSTVVVAEAAAAKAPGIDRPVVDPKPDARPAAKQAAKPAAKPDATRDATRDAPVPLADVARCMSEGRPPDGDGRRKAVTDKAQRHEGAREEKASRIPVRVARGNAKLSSVGASGLLYHGVFFEPKLKVVRPKAEPFTGDYYATGAGNVVRRPYKQQLVECVALLVQAAPLDSPAFVDEVDGQESVAVALAID